MKTLIIVPVSNKIGLLHSDSNCDVFAPHAAYPEKADDLVGRLYDAMIVLPYANIGQGTDSQIKQLATQVHPAPGTSWVKLIGLSDVDQGA